MIQKYLLIILLLLIIGCSKVDDKNYVTFKEVDIFTLIGDEKPDNCSINESGDEVCIWRIEGV